ncbi:hypothetical protein BH11PSE11_BH11PSE11_34680 [soil metagenome]
MNSQPSSFRQNRSLVNYGVAAIIIVVIVAVLSVLLHLRQTAESKAAVATQNLAKAFEITVEGLIDKIDVALLASVEELGEKFAAEDPDIKDIDQYLKRRQGSLPEIATLRTANAAGDVLYSAGNQPVPNIADREYFIRLRDNPAVGLVVGRPVVGRIFHTWVWPIARRVELPDGSFGGIVFAIVRLDKFESLFARIELNVNSPVVLRDADLGLMGRYPTPGTGKIEVGSKQLSAPFVNALKLNRNAGTYRSGSGGIEEMDSIQSYRRSPKHGFVVNVGIAEKAAFAEWRKQVWIISSLAVAFIGALLLFSRLIRRAWKQQERDMAALESSRQALQENEQQLGVILDNIPDGVMLVGSDGQVERANPAAYDLHGIPRDQPLAKFADYFRLFEFRDANGGVMQLRDLPAMRALKGESIKDMEMSIVSRETGKRWDALRWAVPIAQQGQLRALVGVQDITERKQTETLIRNQANFDMLTKLPNRRLFGERLQQHIDRAKQDGTAMALLLIDLDQFKEVNDTLGHDKGDVLLIEVSHRIAACLRESVTLARLGGDEFTVILSDPEDLANAKAIARQIIASLTAPFKLGAEKIFISASIGIAQFPEAGTVAEDLLRHADQAMYAAKNAGRNRYAHFSRELQEASELRMRLTGDMRDALAANQFEVYFQPIIELASGTIRKAEALIRWQHPTRGMVSPAEFIPLAEVSGLILEIGEWVFRQSAQQVRDLRREFDPSFQISVNISPVQFRNDENLNETWRDQLAGLGLPAQSMVIEITEGLLLDLSPEVKDKLHAFGDAGIQVALDDFGTGYSSLAYLKKFDIDYLKIDRAFVSNLETDSDNRALCEAIIIMAHKLGLKVIAEGIETTAQRDFLRSAGCDFAQGYLFSRPVPAAQFEALMKGG